MLEPYEPTTIARVFFAVLSLLLYRESWQTLDLTAPRYPRITRRVSWVFVVSGAAMATIAAFLAKGW